ncbi:glutamate-5-semialdehyde dehydrogenase [Sinanaerobacter chloroacetimidivorans]|jgi:glutamate-5-semialdehyde dehydrogenase|uniref:Gamma-glutamyl phosphate reductase n=1 Tax=Sinanaerobacter chloroacetimidivorans TaxID=2818044 RepID=A0A8J7W0T1_9FIRM|nr:glutamate-5-semialdehyde dehydrogenase [Sinanaerobacter chloroacetimidivorans]MBR0596870.1 glutamate-5-semialdehyde dehydrogenase [Sinanaerobacter chloroacetimidivorans]
MDHIIELTKQIKSDSFLMANLSGEVRNQALSKIAQALLSNRDQILEANQLDLDRGIDAKLSSPIMKRLKFDDQKLSDVVDGIQSLLSLKDPLWTKLLERELDDQLKLYKVTCPIGVIGVIFESRPDALVQIASLCLKSGNCAILKGGSEAAHTNKVLFEIIHKAGVEAGIPEGFLTLIENRADINELLKCHESIDLLIPRGSNEFVQYIMEHSKIPVMGHADGICHIFADKDADPDKAIPIIVDAKTQYVAACNTVETLLVHRDVAETLLPAVKEALEKKDVIIRGCERTREIISCETSEEKDFETEYLDYIISVKVIDSLEDAIFHINKYGSHHTDSIITENSEAAEKFMLLVDSAGVYQNCSTRFADGFRYGFGAEVGISTGKLHARGPVGLDGLVTYKYKLYGNGQIVADYAEGRSSFKFKDL